MKLSVIIPVLNQFNLVHKTLSFLDSDKYNVIVVDNGSDEEFMTTQPNVSVIRIDENIGNYPIFKLALELTDADILAFFHSDLFVYDADWSEKVTDLFEKNDKLGMIGFIGSNEIDAAGGRGLGTRSNFQGQSVIKDTGEKIDTDLFNSHSERWEGSPAEIHGARDTGFSYGVVVDGCAMILRRTALNDIGFKENFPIHHFYDRLISTQLLEKGWKLGVLGIACDHISGQTANTQQKYKETAKRWATEKHITPGGLGVEWDHVIYQEAERQWLKEYRDEKHIVPCRVDNDGNKI